MANPKGAWRVATCITIFDPPRFKSRQSFHISAMIGTRAFRRLAASPVLCNNGAARVRMMSAAASSGDDWDEEHRVGESAT